MKIKKAFIVISIICCLLYVFVSCMDAGVSPKTDARGKAYAGSETCKSCHQPVFDSYQHNEHYRTSWPVHEFPKDILVSSDSFTYNEHVKVLIEHRDSGIFQVAYVDGKETLAKRFDIGFGSGEKAYTFGYWQDKKINQLPLSYFTTIHQWTNSPSFPAHSAYFERPIIRRCMECHSSYIGAALQQTESLSNVRNLDSSTLIYGIDCERCHGPSTDHVAFQKANPDSKEVKHIASWKTLTRQQKLDACGVCHSGNDLETQYTLFAFQPGDTLSNFYYPDFGETPKTPDVHGKQVQLLSASKCFIQSNTLECSSCHTLHGQKPETVSVYAQQCRNCHQEIKHKSPEIAMLDQQVITNKCVDCHMPKEVSRAISFREKDKVNLSDYLLRTHRIAVYPEASKNVLNNK